MFFLSFVASMPGKKKKEKEGEREKMKGPRAWYSASLAPGAGERAIYIMGK